MYRTNNLLGGENVTKKEAERVKIGDKMKWTGEGEPAGGEVVEVGYNAFKVRWEDGIHQIVGFNDPGALKDVARAELR